MLSYPESVQFLYSLGNEIKTAKLGLEFRRSFKPWGTRSRFRSIHVAGTNGKGSTSAMIEAGLRAAGVRTGLFTSPHLIQPTERIQIDGIPVTQSDSRRRFKSFTIRPRSWISIATRPISKRSPRWPSGYFANWRSRRAVVEVGLGGRLDSTNVIRPEVSVITPIDFDHEMYLGHTSKRSQARKQAF